MYLKSLKSDNGSKTAKNGNLPIFSKNMDNSLVACFRFNCAFIRFRKNAKEKLHCSTIGDRTFPVAAARACKPLQIET